MVGTLLAGGGVFLAYLQVRAAKQYAQTSFEDELSREYRSIVGQLPSSAFYLDSDIELDDETRRAFYRYFDLSNEQLFLVRQGRVSESIAEQWRDGIQGNLALPKFRAGWEEIATKVPANFLRNSGTPSAPSGRD